MASHQAQRTLVKSRPELWAEVSDVTSLCRHLGEFGEITITRLEPETTVAWEGTAARGTVELEASGWGTKVTLTAELVERDEAGPAAEPVADVVEAEPDAVVPPEPEPAVPESPVAAQPAPTPAALRSAARVAAATTAASPTSKPGLFGRLFGRRGAEPAAESPPADPSPLRVVPDPEPEPAAPPRPAELPDREAPPEEDPNPPLVATAPPVEEPPVGEVEATPEPVEPVAATPSPEPVVALDGEQAVAVLTAALDDLGAAHRRPFSRS
jgi:hypothetical protein